MKGKKQVPLWDLTAEKIDLCIKSKKQEFKKYNMCFKIFFHELLLLFIRLFFFFSVELDSWFGIRVLVWKHHQSYMLYIL